MQKTAFLIFIMAVALFLRVTGYGWGAGYLLHPDEQFITEPPYWMATKNTSDPGNYMRPSHLSIRLNYLVYNLVSNIRFNKPLEKIYPSYRVFFTYLSRIVVGIWGTLLVLAIFLVAEEITKGSGIWAATIACIFPSYITHSHYVTPDISLALWLALSLWASLKFFKNGHWLYFLLVCIFTGFAITEKYPGLLFAAFLSGHLFFFPNKNAPKYLKNKLITVSLLILGVFTTIFLVSPHLILNFDKVLLAFSSESRTEHVGADGLGWMGNFVFYIQSFTNSGGILLWIVILVGISQYKQLDLHAILILLYPLLFIFILSRVALHWERWAVPFYIFPIITAGIGLHFAYKTFGKIPTILVFTVSMVFMLLNTLQILTYFLHKENTVKQAMEFCDKNGISRENSLYGSWTPFSPSGRFDFDFKSHYENPSYLASKKYVIVSSGAYEPIFNSRPADYPENLFYNQLLSKKAFYVIHPQIPQNHPSTLWLWEAESIKDQLHFLYKIWIKKEPYVPGEEIRFYTVADLR